MMAAYKYGKPVVVKGTPSAAYSAGDVIVQGSLPMVAHVDNPVSPTMPITVDSLAVGGGVYTVAAAGAYGVGTYVYWDATVKQVTTTAAGNTGFGWIVGGPTGQWNDGGPTGAGSLCDVFHAPK